MIDIGSVAQDFGKWRAWLAAGLIVSQVKQYPGIKAIASCYEVDEDFDDHEMLTYLVLLVLTCDATFRKPFSDHLNLILSSDRSSQRSVEFVLEVYLSLRNYIPEGGDIRLRNEWLSLASLDLVHTAYRCKRYDSGVLLMEILWEQNPDLIIPSNLKQSIYRSVNDPDTFYGIQGDDTRSSLVSRLEHEGDWERVLLYHSARFNITKTPAELYEPLRNLDLYQLAQDLTSWSGKSDEASSDLELYWRTSSWSIPVDEYTLANSHDGVLYNVLQVVHQDCSSRVVDRTISESLEIEAGRLRTFGSEAYRETRDSLTRMLGLRLLYQLEKDCDPQGFIDGINQSVRATILTVWLC